MTKTDETKAPTGDDSTYGAELQGTIFPYVDNAQHWDVDFNDTHQSYEGSALPPWILGGFVVFVLWAIVYMIFALT